MLVEITEWITLLSVPAKVFNRVMKTAAEPRMQEEPQIKEWTDTLTGPYGCPGYFRNFTVSP